MGVYIKDMEMPKDGVYWCEIGVAGEIATITIHGEDRKWFPLVPVPPHGRLIDADAFCTEHRSLKMLRKVWLRRFNWHIAAAAFVDDAPTIIPATEAEEET